MSAADVKDNQFDEDAKNDMMNLMSRTVAVYGADVMHKLSKMRVLIVGLKGIGIEVAKNLCLAGPGSVTLYDNNPAEEADCGTNFYLSESDKGKARAVVVEQKLAQLNSYVKVQAHTGELNEHFLANFNAVVFTDGVDLSQADLVRFNKYCRERTQSRINPYSLVPEEVPSPIAFFMAHTGGVASSVFVDLGPEHTVLDPDGLPVKSHVVEYISSAGLVTISGDNHGLSDGDLVRFEEVVGMDDLNSADPIPIKRVYGYNSNTNRQGLLGDRFELAPPADSPVQVNKLGTYKNGGIVTQVKKPTTLTFQSLAEQLQAPTLLMHPDSAKAFGDEVVQLHFAMLALFAFQAKNGSWPRVHNEDDAKECVVLAQEIAEQHKAQGAGAVQVEKINEDVVRNVALFARTELPCFTTMLGGIVAQEVIKLPGKYTPIRQMLHFAQFQLLKNGVPPPGTGKVPARYSHQVAVFGEDFQEQLSKQKWFLVGSGALGCEYLKGFALAGVGAGKDGCIHVTDMDTVEVSNLSRQFLFRRKHVGKLKSVAAAEAVADMNPSLAVKVYQTRVAPDTEDLFDDEFWDGLDGVCNALDNVPARVYTCSKCVLHEKPLLESGTLGTKCHNEVILPYKTDIYRKNEDEKEENIPACTIHNFPHYIEHCIIWARAQFMDNFTDGPLGVKSLITNKEEFFKSVANEGNSTIQREKLESVKRLLQLSKDMTFKKCVELAVQQFVDNFRNRIKDLTHSFPKDATNKDGSAFWSGHKRFPNALELDLDSEDHFNFVMCAANLLAFNFGLTQERDSQKIKDMARAVAIEPWKEPSDPVTIELEEDKKSDEEKESEEDKAVVDALTAELKAFDTSSLKPMHVAEFEKDDDTNFHIDFIAATANLRAANYHIKRSTRHQVKIIAGKIIPAVATSTALITGVNIMEMYKVVLGLDVGQHLNAYFDLAVSQLQLWEPSPPPKTQSEDFNIEIGGPVVAVPPDWTPWDRIVIDKGDLTVQQFLDEFSKTHHGCVAEMISSASVGGGKIIYSSSFAYGDRFKPNLPRNLVDVYVESYGAIPAKRRYLLLNVDAVTADDDDAVVPVVKYVFSAPPPQPH